MKSTAKVQPCEKLPLQFPRHQVSAGLAPSYVIVRGLAFARMAKSLSELCDVSTVKLMLISVQSNTNYIPPPPLA